MCGCAQQKNDVEFTFSGHKLNHKKDTNYPVSKDSTSFFLYLHCAISFVLSRYLHFSAQVLNSTGSTISTRTSRVGDGLVLSESYTYIHTYTFNHTL